MDIFAILQSKKNKEAYQLLLLLEKQSEESAELYPLFEDFLGLLGSESAFVRVRGFRLACAQAKWDTENKLGTHLDRHRTGGPAVSGRAGTRRTNQAGPCRPNQEQFGQHGAVKIRQQHGPADRKGPAGAEKTCGAVSSCQLTK